MPRIFVYVTHKAGVADDSAFEMPAAAAKIDAAARPTALVAGCGPELDAVCESLRATYPEVWKLAAGALAYPNAELVRQALVRVLPAGGILLASHDHFGMDLTPGLAVKMNWAYVPDVVGIEGARGSCLDLIRQEFGGQVSVRIDCDISSGAVLTIRPGAFSPVAAADAGGVVVEQPVAADSLTARRRYLRTIAAERGEVDITRQEILVSVGRGIQDEENIAIAQELADALGAAVSCSRPVVDSKWLDKSRQVGSSGQTVKPKVYLACGISGSSQHVAGIRGNPFIVAVNKNPRAPIFQVANVGIVDDILEFLPALTARIRQE